MNGKVKIGARMVGHGEPAFVVAEIGINHNGDLDTAKRLIDTADLAGCDAVKFQKRTPELCVPADQRKAMRETPWGYISYLEYRYRVEFGKKEYDEIARYCEERKMIWFASAWDKPSVDFLEQYSPACYKIPSALLTHHELLLYVRRTFAASYPFNGHVDDGTDKGCRKSTGYRKFDPGPLHQYLSL